MIDQNLVQTMLLPALGQNDTVELRTKIVRAVMLWLYIREDAGYHFPDNIDSLRIDMSHSALLHRLLSGKAPLPSPPPKHFSSPWYELIEDGFAIPFEVWETKGTWAEDNFEHDTIYIDQQPWTVVESRGPRDWLVKHERDDGVWRLWSTGRKEGSSEKDEKVPSTWLWRIERHAETSP